MCGDDDATDIVYIGVNHKMIHFRIAYIYDTDISVYGAEEGGYGLRDRDCCRLHTH